MATKTTFVDYPSGLPGKLVDTLTFAEADAAAVLVAVDLTDITLSTLDFALRVDNNWTEEVTVTVYDAATAIMELTSFTVAASSSRTVLVEGWLSSGVGSIQFDPAADVDGDTDCTVEIREV